jgi:hypothetical protein
MDIGIKGSNNEPQGTTKMARNERMPEYRLMAPTKSPKLLVRRMRTRTRSTHRLTPCRP